MDCLRFDSLIHYLDSQDGYDSHYIIAKKQRENIAFPCLISEQPDSDELAVRSPDQVRLLFSQPGFLG